MVCYHWGVFILKDFENYFLVPKCYKVILRVNNVLCSAKGRPLQCNILQLLHQAGANNGPFWAMLMLMQCKIISRCRFGNNCKFDEKHTNLINIFGNSRASIQVPLRCRIVRRCSLGQNQDHNCQFAADSQRASLALHHHHAFFSSFHQHSKINESIRKIHVPWYQILSSEGLKEFLTR